MRNAGSAAACASPLLKIVKTMAKPLTAIDPWVRYLYSPGLVHTVRGGEVVALHIA